jgi:hypothetical protein
VGQDSVRDRNGVSWHKVNNAWWHTSLFEDLHDEVVAEHSVISWLPNNHISEDSRGRNEVSTNSGKVEGSDGIDESLERSVLKAVPHTLGRMRLGDQNVLSIASIESPEIGQLLKSRMSSVPCSA